MKDVITKRRLQQQLCEWLRYKNSDGGWSVSCWPGAVGGAASDNLFNSHISPVNALVVRFIFQRNCSEIVASVTNHLSRLFKVAEMRYQSVWSKRVLSSLGSRSLSSHGQIDIIKQLLSSPTSVTKTVGNQELLISHLSENQSCWSQDSGHKNLSVGATQRELFQHKYYKLETRITFID